MHLAGSVAIIDGSVSISNLAVGDNVVSWYYNYSDPASNSEGTVYNYTGDNWRQSVNKPEYMITGASGTVSKIIISNVDSYKRYTFTGILGFYIHLNIDENQVLGLMNTDYSFPIALPINPNIATTGAFFSRALDINNLPYAILTEQTSRYSFSGKETINTPTQLYNINVSPYNTFQITGTPNGYGANNKAIFVHDSIFTAKTIYSY